MASASHRPRAPWLPLELRREGLCGEEEAGSGGGKGRDGGGVDLRAWGFPALPDGNPSLQPGPQSRQELCTGEGAGSGAGVRPHFAWITEGRLAAAQFSVLTPPPTRSFRARALGRGLPCEGVRITVRVYECGRKGTPLHSLSQSKVDPAPGACTTKLGTGLLNEAVCVCVCVYQTILPPHPKTLISVAGSVICTASGRWVLLSPETTYKNTHSTASVCMGTQRHTHSHAHLSTCTQAFPKRHTGGAAEMPHPGKIPRGSTCLPKNIHIHIQTCAHRYLHTGGKCTPRGTGAHRGLASRLILPRGSTLHRVTIY